MFVVSEANSGSKNAGYAVTADRRVSQWTRLGRTIPGVCTITVIAAFALGSGYAAAADPTATPNLTPTADSPEHTSPSTTPSPTPTPPEEPSPAPTHPEPRQKSTVEPTEEPSKTPEPPTVPADERPPSPTDGKDPGVAYDEALEGAQTTAVAEAQRLIHEVMVAIGAAEVVVAEAAAKADDARAAADSAAREVQITEEAAARTQRDISALWEEQQTTRRTLGAVAAQAYQGGAETSTMAALFSSESPADLTDTYVSLGVLLRANDRALGTLATSEADLRNARVSLDAQLERRRQQADEARQLADEAAGAEEAARASQRALEEQNTKLEHALELAEDARIEDYQRYMELLGESTELGELLRDKSDYGPGYGTGDFVRPGTGGFTSRYGPRRHPILGYVKTHTGLDFGRGDGVIYAADAGTVITAEWNRAYGYVVVLDHGVIGGRRVSTMYAHQPGLSVSVGQRVEKGQPIGQVGSTGYSTGPHLHFEVFVDGEHTDPMPWVGNAPYPN